jgi:hypothetical protein
MPGVSAAAKVVAKKAAPLPEPVAHAAKLRGQGMTDAQVSKAMGDMGYPKSAPAPAAPSAPAPAPGPAISAGAGTGQARRSFPTASSSGGGAGGFILGLVGTAVLINYMRGGTEQVKRWAAAKFLNQTTADPGGGGGGSSW